jgi:hypothetical protein
LLTFAEIEGVPATNNHAEREIRAAVIMRKISYGSASQQGVTTRAILMSILRILKNRGLNPLAELRTALKIYLNTQQLHCPVQQGEGLPSSVCTGEASGTQRHEFNLIRHGKIIHSNLSTLRSKCAPTIKVRSLNARFHARISRLFERTRFAGSCRPRTCFAAC